MSLCWPLTLTGKRPDPVESKRNPMNKPFNLDRPTSLWKLFTVLSVVLAGCSTGTVTNPVTWYASNAGAAIRVVIYDEICERRIGNVRISSRRETPITTCGDENGEASVRYRGDNYPSRSETWTRRTGIRNNQLLIMQ